MDKSVILSRKNPILSVRLDQITLNLLAVDGGRPYIDRQLWRAPNESDLSWLGTSSLGGSVVGVVGRQQRACCINDAGRVAAKINQYLFAESPSRPDIDEVFSKDVTATGVSVGDFWEDVSEQVTAGQWCWVQVDRGAPSVDPATGKPNQRSMADRDAVGDRVRWVLWPAVSVVDWRFDTAGRLEWLLTEEAIVDNADPMVEPTTANMRRLWKRNATGATWETWKETSDGIPEKTSYGSISSPNIPFVLVGTPTDKPWWFDTVEGIQAQVMNLDSLHIENLTRTVFGQLVIPQSSLDSLEARLIERSGQESGGNRILELVREIVRGLDSPMIESGEEKGITRFIQPSASDLAALPDEVKRKRQMLFDTAGLALFNKESRQVQTAESKQFDHLDTEATLRRRALMLQEAEIRIVEASVAIDATFTQYVPVWPDSFDVTDVSIESGALADIGQISNLTLTQRKLVLQVATRLLSKMTRVSEEDATTIKAELEALTEEDFSFKLTPPAPADDTKDNGGGPPIDDLANT